MSEPAWMRVAAEAQDYRDASIRDVQPAVPEVADQDLTLNVSELPRKYLSVEEVELTESSTENLVSALARGDLTAVAVVTAFLRRAGIAQAATNCITELLPGRALERAKYLDSYYAEHGETVGRLHGLPISVKEHIGMKGLNCNAGFVSWWHSEKQSEDAEILKILWKAGCIFYARTTEPQLLMHLETASNLYGHTLNPFNRDLTPGGSSGGEGALLAMRGSCLGLGTDIGGSVRSPAANCGLYSLRPTARRLPYGGCVDSADGQEQILGTIGPMSTSLRGLEMLMQTVLEAEPWFIEPGLAQHSWRDMKKTCQYTPAKKLKIAVMWHDGVVRPHPPVTRALDEVVSKLKDLDWVEILNWRPEQNKLEHDYAWYLTSSLYYPDAGSGDKQVMQESGEPWLPLSKWILLDNPHVQNKNLPEFWELLNQRDNYRAKYLRYWNQTSLYTDKQTGKRVGEVDVILCPAGPGVAPKHGTSKYWCYTSQWNLLDYPALVFPVTRVDVWRDEKPTVFKPMSNKDTANWALYDDPNSFEGAPVSLQLVGRTMEDEKVVEIMSLIKNAIGLPFVNYI